MKPFSSSQIRFDHFQRGRNLVITFYGKLCDYTVCSVKASSISLQNRYYSKEAISLLRNYLIYILALYPRNLL